MRVRVYGDDSVKMKTRGRVLGAEWNGRYLKQCTDLRPPARCVYIHPPKEKGRKKEKKRNSALPTPFLPLRPLLQPPAAPSHSSYEPRAGRSEYNFLYCVNVRTIRLNKKKNVYITKRRRLDHCVSHSPPSNVHPRDEGVAMFYVACRRDVDELGDSLEF